MVVSNRVLLRALSALAGVALAVGAYVFLTIPADPSAAYFPTVRAATSDLPSGVDTVRVGATKTPRQLPQGPIYRPNSSLTPGAVATADIRSVCAAPKTIHSLFQPGTLNTSVPPAIQLAVFNAYRIPAQRIPLYGLDFLIPLQLGGAVSVRNIWPIPKTTHGLGFHDKEVLNIRMHIVACHGEIPLAQAQKAIASDWVSVWVQYGA